MADQPVIIFQKRRIAVGRSLIVGRQADCDLRIKSAGTSRHHARLEPLDDTLVIEDLGSSNGTRVNGELIYQAVTLADGDRIGIGQAEFLVELPQKSSVSTHDPAVHHDDDDDPMVFPTYQEHAPDDKPPVAVDTAESATAGHGSSTRNRAAVRPQALIGEQISGYQIEDLIAADDTSATYLARQLSLGRDVALTVLTADLAAEAPEQADSLLSELHAAARIDHANLVLIHECARTDDLVWYTTGLIDGNTIEQLLERDGHLDLELSLMIIERTLQALSAAHGAGICHGDIRLETVMLDISGQVKLTNLGLAQLYRTLRGSQRSNRSPAFTAPELTQRPDATVAGDLYAIGCLTVAMLTGKPPYGGRHAEQILTAHREEPIPLMSELSPELGTICDPLVAGLLNKDPQWRFTTADEALVEVAAVRQQATNQMPAVKPASAPKKTKTAGGKRPRSTASAEALPRSARSRQARKANPFAWVIKLAVLAVLIVVALVAWPRVQVHLEPLLGQSAQTQTSSNSNQIETSPSQALDAVEPREAPEQTPNTPTVSTNTSANTNVNPRPLTQTPAGSGSQLNLSQQWDLVETQVNELTSQQEWRQAERVLQSFLNRAQRANEAELVRGARSVQQRLLLKSSSWYTQASKQLASITEPRERLMAADDLLKRAAGYDRGDAHQRYQGAADQLLQEIAVSRVQARRTMEAGDIRELNRVAQAIKPMFDGTPLYSQYQAFELACQFAENIQWHGSWVATFETLLDQRDNLAAGAALWILGDQDGLIDNVFSNNRWSYGSDREQRDLLLASLGKVLTFDDATDGDALSIDVGGIELSDGILGSSDTDGFAARLDGPERGPWATVIDAAWNPLHEDESVLSVYVTDGSNGVLSIGIEPSEDLEGWVITWQAGEQSGQQAISDPSAPFHVELLQLAEGCTIRWGADDLITQAPVEFNGQLSISLASAFAELAIDRVATHYPSR